MYPNLPKKGDSQGQGQETFLSPAIDQQTRNYDMTQSAQITIPSNPYKAMGLSVSKMKLRYNGDISTTILLINIVKYCLWNKGKNKSLLSTVFLNF